MATYNGHKNRNHWNVALTLSNTEDLYSICRFCIRMANNKNEAAYMILGMLPKKTPDGTKYTFSTVRAAIRHW